MVDQFQFNVGGTTVVLLMHVSPVHCLCVDWFVMCWVSALES